MERVIEIGAWLWGHPAMAALGVAVIVFLLIADAVPHHRDCSISVSDYYGRLFTALFAAATLPFLIVLGLDLSEDWLQPLLVGVFAFGILVQRPWQW